MSKISTVYDAMLTRLGVLYPNKTRIPNPYNIEDNNDNFLIDGFGLIVDSSAVQPHEFCNFNVERTFTVILTREMIATDSDETKYDSVAKLLLEDVYTLQKDFYNVNQLASEASIEQISLGPSSGVSEIFSGKINHLSIETSFLIQVRELL